METSWRALIATCAVPAVALAIWGIGEDQRALVSDLDTQTAPSLATTRGTSLGAEDFAAFVPNRPRMTRQRNALIPLPHEAWAVLPVEEQVDAVLDLGPTSAMSEAAVPARACAARGFLDERLPRIALAGIPSLEADRLRAVCGAPAPRP